MRKPLGPFLYAVLCTVYGVSQGLCRLRLKDCICCVLRIVYIVSQQLDARELAMFHEPPGELDSTWQWLSLCKDVWRQKIRKVAQCGSLC